MTIRSTFTHAHANASKLISDAKLIVAVATEAEDSTLRTVSDIIRRRIILPNSYAHPAPTIPKTVQNRNALLEEIACEIESLINDDIPF